MLFRQIAGHFDWIANIGQSEFGNVCVTQGSEQEAAAILDWNLGHRSRTGTIKKRDRFHSSFHQLIITFASSFLFLNLLHIHTHTHTHIIFVLLKSIWHIVNTHTPIFSDRFSPVNTRFCCSFVDWYESDFDDSFIKFTSVNRFFVAFDSFCLVESSFPTLAFSHNSGFFVSQTHHFSNQSVSTIPLPSSSQKFFFHVNTRDIVSIPKLESCGFSDYFWSSRASVLFTTDTVFLYFNCLFSQF